MVTRHSGIICCSVLFVIVLFRFLQRLLIVYGRSNGGLLLSHVLLEHGEVIAEFDFAYVHDLAALN